MYEPSSPEPSAIATHPFPDFATGVGSQPLALTAPPSAVPSALTPTSSAAAAARTEEGGAGALAQAASRQDALELPQGSPSATPRQEGEPDAGPHADPNADVDRPTLS